MRSPEEIIGQDALTQLIFEGYAVVPAEPTDEMVIAGVCERHGQPVPEAWSKATVNIFRAMVEAAK